MANNLATKRRAYCVFGLIFVMAACSASNVIHVKPAPNKTSRNAAAGTTSETSGTDSTDTTSSGGNPEGGGAPTNLAESVVPVSVRHPNGGGILDGGLVGEYFANSSLSGAPVFVRKDARIDFDWGSNLNPGGSITTNFASVTHDSFSVRWVGKVVPKFSETYTFTTLSDDGVRVYLKPANSTNWEPLINNWTLHNAQKDVSEKSLVASENYDIKIEYAQRGGNATMQLFWSSPSTPLEIIDAVSHVGINNPLQDNAGFVDIVKGARNTWNNVDTGAEITNLDSSGWPKQDASYCFQESFNFGLDIDPIMFGKIGFSFVGSGDVSIRGNVDLSSLHYSYDAPTNTTTGSFLTKNNKWNASTVNIRNSHRDGRSNGPAGFTNLELLRPKTPGDTVNSNSFFETTLFTTETKTALSKFTVLRFQLVSNYEMNWTDRTLPNFFNQSNGSKTALRYRLSPYQPEYKNNGHSWEYKIMLANETGRDLMLSIPTLATGRNAADTQSYMVNLAKLLRYGSDGVNPYNGPVANPLYPPLNPNLRVYLEIANELWNFGADYWSDYANIRNLATLDADANNEDFAIINFDNLTLEKNSDGHYKSEFDWTSRKIVHRMMQISSIFRSVFGDDAMMRRIRPLFEWQYDNANLTASLGLEFADTYFNNGDGKKHVTNPKPLSYWLWGGGGAAYYSAANSTGKTSILANGSFEFPVVSEGSNEAPTGGNWSFLGSAGIARPQATPQGILIAPEAKSGKQYAYITDTGSISTSLTVDATGKYGVVFRSVNASTNRQKLRVFLDDVEISARTPSQGDGYVPLSADTQGGQSWGAQNVWWWGSQYYYTQISSLQANSTHTLSIRGCATGTAFVDEIALTSLEKFYSDGIPAGGEAAGQPGGSAYQQMINTEVSYAKVMGLEMLAYESGWSLGGDDGGSVLQNQAKYVDSRTREAQKRASDIFHMAGGLVNVFGTYTLWPNWSDYLAEQGLLDVTKYPLMQGIIDSQSSLPPSPTNGKLLPVTFAPKDVNTDAAKPGYAMNGRYGFSQGEWGAWNIINSTAKTFVVTVDTATTNTPDNVDVWIDDIQIATGKAGTRIIGNTPFLTTGLHVVRVRNVGQTQFSVTQIDIR